MEEIKAILKEVLIAVNHGNPIALIVLTGLTALTEVGIPTFGLIDAVLLYVGYEFGLLSWRALIVITLMALGRLLGGSAIYWPSRILGERFIKWLQKRFPSINSKITQATFRLSKRQALAVVIIRFTPGLLTAGSVAAGMLKVKNRNYLLGVLIHAVIADVILILIGYLGRFGVKLVGIHLRGWQVLLAAILVVIAFSLGMFLWQRLRKKKKERLAKSGDSADKPVPPGSQQINK